MCGHAPARYCVSVSGSLSLSLCLCCAVATFLLKYDFTEFTAKLGMADGRTKGNVAG